MPIFAESRFSKVTHERHKLQSYWTETHQISTKCTEIIHCSCYCAYKRCDRLL